ncbi:MAG: hypothetical protein OEO77_07465, partial [Acidimicrobiia bacterium]|nr:hypothetical protein [Acidimicrobiia bacterium]
TFSAAVADIASAIRGVPKDELESEEVRQHRRTVRTAWAAGGLVAVLAIVAVLAGIVAIGQRDAADRNARLALARELAASAVNVLEEDPELAILLTLEAIDATPEGIDQPTEVINALWQAIQEDRLVRVIDTGYGGRTHAGLSGDGSLLAVSSEEGQSVALYSVPAGELLWEYKEETTDSFYLAFVSPDGEHVAVGILDSTGIDVSREAGPDDLPNRILLLDAGDGSIDRTLSFSNCANVAAFGWSPQGTYFAVSSGVEGCERPDGSDGSWVELLDGATFDPVHLIDGLDMTTPVPRFDDAENLYVFNGDGLPVQVYEAPSYAEGRQIDGVASLGDVSADGSVVVTFDPGSANFLAAFDTATGNRIDFLRPVTAFLSFPVGPDFFPTGERVSVVTEGRDVLVWDVGTGEQVFRLPGGPGRNGVASFDGSWLYTAHLDGKVKVWDLGPAGGLDSIGDLGSYEYINGNAFSVGPTLGSAVAIDPAEFDFQIIFFDRATGAFVGEPIGSGASAKALANDRFLVDIDGEWTSYDPLTGERAFVSGCRVDIEGDQSICVDTGESVPADPVASVDGSEIALPPEDGDVHIIDASSGEIRDVVRPHLSIVAFTSEWIFGESDSGGYLSVGRSTGEELARIDGGTPRIEASEAGDLIVMWEQDTVTLTVIATSDWTVETFPLELGRVRGIAPDPDLLRVALGDENGLHIMDIETGQISTSIPLPSVSDIHWLDSDTVLVGTTNGVWAAVPLDTRVLIAAAREGVTRGFTSAECETYRISSCDIQEN